MDSWRDSIILRPSSALTLVLFFFRSSLGGGEPGWPRVLCTRARWKRIIWSRESPSPSFSCLLVERGWLGGEMSYSSGEQRVASDDLWNFAGDRDGCLLAVRAGVWGNRNLRSLGSLFIKFYNIFFSNTTDWCFDRQTSSWQQSVLWLKISEKHRQVCNVQNLAILEWVTVIWPIESSSISKVTGNLHQSVESLRGPSILKFRPRKDPIFFFRKRVLQPNNSILLCLAISYIY